MLLKEFAYDYIWGDNREPARGILGQATGGHACTALCVIRSFVSLSFGELLAYFPFISNRLALYIPVVPCLIDIG